MSKQVLVICENDGLPLRAIVLPHRLKEAELLKLQDLAEYYGQEIHDFSSDEANSAEQVEEILREMNPEDGDEDDGK